MQILVSNVTQVTFSAIVDMKNYNTQENSYTPCSPEQCFAEVNYVMWFANCVYYTDLGGIEISITHIVPNLVTQKGAKYKYTHANYFCLRV